MKRSKRYIITVLAGFMLSTLSLLSVLKGMEAVATVCVGGIMTILSTYIWGETKRPSNNPEP
jgi:hypothetical protein